MYEASWDCALPVEFSWGVLPSQGFFYLQRVGIQKSDRSQVKGMSTYYSRLHIVPTWCLDRTYSSNDRELFEAQRTYGIYNFAT